MSTLADRVEHIMICTFNDRRLLAGRNRRLCSSCERTTANEFSLPEHQSMATRTILQMQDCSCFMVMLDLYPMSLHPCEVLLFVWYFCRHLCLSIKSLSTFSFFSFFQKGNYPYHPLLLHETRYCLSEALYYSVGSGSKNTVYVNP